MLKQKVLLPFLFLSLGFLLVTGCEKQPTAVRIDVTTDVHGMIFPLDLINGKPSDHSLAQVYTHIQKVSSDQDTALIFLDNGDFLQGQPTVYYFNTMRRDTLHISSRVMNFMGYNAGTIGNHDIETGPAVYNKIRNEFNFPWLAANIIDTTTGKPAFQPYTVIKKGKLKIAVFGLTTPGVPNWLPESLWPGLAFRDMIETAREWVPVIIEKEQPDLLVGLFHAGTDFTYGHQDADTKLNQNATVLVVEQVPGFDVVFAGHDHESSINWIVNTAGDSVLVVDPGSHAGLIGEVVVNFQGREKQKKISHYSLIPVKELEISAEFMKKFSYELTEVQNYLSDTITILDTELRSLDGLFGPSAFIGLIQQIQLELSGAQLSFTSPLSFNTVLEKGPVRVSDMFKLYRFENMLYSMKLTGEEIDRYLEYSASLWFNRVMKPGDHLLLFDPAKKDRLKNQYYNFSSATGINYTIDVTGPVGDRVTITSFTDGRKFSETDTYTVAINSYRGNGGGGHLTAGAGIPAGELASRIVWSTDIDLRYYMMQYMSEFDTLRPPVPHNWKLIPEKPVAIAAEKDRELLENK